MKKKKLTAFAMATLAACSVSSIVALADWKRIRKQRL